MTAALPVQGPPAPLVGDVVMAFVHPALNNGSDVAPAVVTRVSDSVSAPWTCNLRLLCDARPSLGLADEWQPGVVLFESQEQAAAARRSFPTAWLRGR